MFKPSEVYSGKKAKKLTESGDEAIQQLKDEYFRLSDKKMLKFIKKAENKYDSYAQAHSDEGLPPFSNYLGKKELLLLLKSYGMPEKPPANSRQAVVLKLKSEAMENNTSEKAAFQEATERYNKLSEREKHTHLTEYHKVLDEYHEKFFWFARNLPSERVEDYKNFLSKKSNTETDESDSAARRKTSHQNGVHGSPKEKKSHAGHKEKDEKKEILKNMYPFTQFLKKHPQDQSDDLKDLNAFMYNSKMRTKYTSLSDKKKLKHIKEAESIYDAFKDWNEIGEAKQPFNKFLNKKELKLLLDSYGMPESIPLTNPSAYYFKIQMKQGTNPDMKSIFESYKTMPEDEKKKFIDDYNKAVEDYVARNQSFLSQLPLSRLEDYNAYKSKKPKSEDKKSTTKSGKLVKSSDSVHHASHSSDDENNSGEETEEEASMKLKRKLIEENSNCLKSKKSKLPLSVKEESVHF